MKKAKQQEEVVVEVKQEQKKEESVIMKEESKKEQEEVKKEKQEENKPVKSINFPELVDVVLDPDGKVVYLVKDKDNLSISRRWITKEEIFITPSKTKMPFKLVNAGDVFYRYYSKMYRKPLYKKVENYFRKACYLTDEQFLLVSLYVFATYLRDHKDIRYMPIILFFAEPERGKTRIGRSMINISYRGIHTVNLLAPSIFRYTNDHRASIFFDVMDFWNDTLKSGIKDIFLLGFEKGATISRVLYPDRGAFDDTKAYDVFGPMIIATNQAVHHILGTRCIEISTPNMPGEYTDYLATDKVVLNLKAMLTVWKAEVMDNPLPLVEKVDGINGRLWDISQTLLKVCKMVCPEKYDILISALLKQAKGRAEDKKESVEGRIINIIYELSTRTFSKWIMLSAVLDRLNDDLPERNKYTSQRLGRKLKALGVETDRTTGRSRLAIDQPVLDKLYDQYGCKISNEVDTDDRENSENSDNTEKLIRLVQ